MTRDDVQVGAPAVRLDRPWPAGALLRPALDVAPRLLGAVLTSELQGTRVRLRIVEVEAYAGVGEDPASHAHRGRTDRNASMFEPAGTAYVYFTYGMHWCLNLVTGPAGEASAVLLRAGEVTEGFDAASARRRSGSGRSPARRDLARGPARLCAALGVTGRQDGLDLLDPGSPLWLAPPADREPDGPERRPPAHRSGPRVGVRRGAERAWRFWLGDEPAVSAFRAHQRAR